MYDPYGRSPGILHASKLMCWALNLSAFRYQVEYIPGERNVRVDMLTRGCNFRHSVEQQRFNVEVQYYQFQACNYSINGNTFRTVLFAPFKFQVSENVCPIVNRATSRAFIVRSLCCVKYFTSHYLTLDYRCALLVITTTF